MWDDDWGVDEMFEAPSVDEIFKCVEASQAEEIRKRRKKEADKRYRQKEKDKKTMLLAECYRLTRENEGLRKENEGLRRENEGLKNSLKSNIKTPLPTYSAEYELDFYNNKVRAEIMNMPPPHAAVVDVNLENNTLYICDLNHSSVPGTSRPY